MKFAARRFRLTATTMQFNPVAFTTLQTLSQRAIVAVLHDKTKQPQSMLGVAQ